MTKTEREDDGTLTPEEEELFERQRASEVRSAVDLTKCLENEVAYREFGASENDPLLRLTYDEVYRVVAQKSKSGYLPQERDIRLFMKLCKMRGLNPYVGDVCLIGFEPAGTRGEADVEWKAIVQHPALLKRARLAKDYRGKASGVVVHEEGNKGLEGIHHIDGICYPPDMSLLGAWCRVLIDGYEPEYKEAKLSAYSSGKNRWSKDPEGMIVKCVEALSLRAAFPGELSDLYAEEEFDHKISPPEKTQIGDESPNRMSEAEAIEGL